MVILDHNIQQQRSPGQLQPRQIRTTIKHTIDGHIIEMPAIDFSTEIVIVRHSPSPGRDRKPVDPPQGANRTAEL
jgi:hypothetical protein